MKHTKTSSLILISLAFVLIVFFTLVIRFEVLHPKEVTSSSVQAPTHSTEPCFTQQWVKGAATSKQYLDEFASFDEVKLPTELSEDIDGDGVIDSIKLTEIPGSNGENSWYKYNLTINNKTQTDELVASDGLVLLDIDKTDHYKEIAVHSSAPSSDHRYQVYRYKDRNVVNIGDIEGWLETPLPGDNTLTTKNWDGFWIYPLTYKYDSAKNQINLVSDLNTYTMNVSATTSAAVGLLKNVGTTERVTSLCPGEQVKFIQSKHTPGASGVHDEWYEVQRHDGSTGWLYLLDLSDNFSDLHFAD